MKHVMPTLAQGLIECCKMRPEDPVDFVVSCERRREFFLGGAGGTKLEYMRVGHEAEPEQIGFCLH